ncbi:MAG TPA: GNAT family N-acetyltransferase [Tenuifilaceae bacterium]|nr:GNAT family N-acetyltransferase [Tenuifilaceae bacterium]HPE17035.1 GNAT family N-acetyltransferase [Tenuifilaceae bacterium]HPJ44680.1 GNAT family N-acetyltransferase [Tenuifilaceae bacterium]HPQ32944.1 GNAT family N-acetyltransferase [Tenuifilaceae bacterium]HRX66762.1 GNAT family N-acetyltransferase [Tenuifilaceae bacterium]
MVTYRTEPTQADINNVKEIISSSGFFQDHEIPVAIELVEERLENGVESGYHFIFVDIDGRTVAYSCFGEIPCTKGSYDLYWIATHQDFRGKGVGKKLMAETMAAIAKLGGRYVYIETSSKQLYEPTRKFYENLGCSTEAILKDFYDTNDHKYIYRLGV